MNDEYTPTDPDFPTGHPEQPAPIPAPTDGPAITDPTIAAVNLIAQTLSDLGLPDPGDTQRCLATATVIATTLDVNDIVFKNRRRPRTPTKR